MALKWPDKDPEEVLDYPIGFGEWLVEGCNLNPSPAPTVVLEGVSVPSGLTDLIVDNVFVAGQNLIVWLSAGTDGETYTYKVTAQDTATPERTGVRRVRIKVKLK